MSNEPSQTLTHDEEDLWKDQREFLMRRACRIIGIPYKPEYRDIGRYRPSNTSHSPRQLSLFSDK